VTTKKRFPAPKKQSDPAVGGAPRGGKRNHLGFVWPAPPTTKKLVGWLVEAPWGATPQKQGPKNKKGFVKGLGGCTAPTKLPRRRLRGVVHPQEKGPTQGKDKFPLNKAVAKGKHGGEPPHEQPGAKAVKSRPKKEGDPTTSNTHQHKWTRELREQIKKNPTRCPILKKRNRKKKGGSLWDKPEGGGGGPTSQLIKGGWGKKTSWGTGGLESPVKKTVFGVGPKGATEGKK